MRDKGMNSIHLPQVNFLNDYQFLGHQSKHEFLQMFLRHGMITRIRIISVWNIAQVKCLRVPRKQIIHKCALIISLVAKHIFLNSFKI